MSNRFHQPSPSVFVLLLLAIIGLPLLQSADSSTTGSPGLSTANGKILLEGKPFRGVGANYFSLFSRILKNPEDKSSLTNLASLANRGIPFARFMCGGYWPVEQGLYRTNKEEFFRRLDLVVRQAEQSKIGLIPSLFWHLPTVPDLAGEPMSELGRLTSKSLGYIREYTREVVSRYQGSPAIWAWEFGNEASLAVDLPNAAEQRPPVVPALGTAPFRTAADELSSEALTIAFRAFANTVRQSDAHRLVISGNAIPRDSAWHNTQERSWESDNRAQFFEVLRRDNPDPMDVLSVHLYPAAKYPVGARNMDQLIGLLMEAAAAAGKPLFIGEFGAALPPGSDTHARAKWVELLSTIEKHSVALSAFWVFDYPDQDGDYNIAFGNDRGFLIQRVADLNAKWRSSGSTR